jgi:hypothetical protein
MLRIELSFGTQFALTKTSRINCSWNRRGDDVRGPIVFASLIACTALFPPQYAASDEPAGRIVRAPESPNTIGRTTRAYDDPSIPTKPSVNVPPMRAPRQQPANLRPEPARNVEVTRNSGNPVDTEPPLIGGHTVDSLGEIAITVTADSGGCDTNLAEVDEGAFLWPTWDRGFWLMPPGGLTRYLIPARGLINPDETLARGPVVATSDRRGREGQQ